MRNKKGVRASEHSRWRVRTVARPGAYPGTAAVRAPRTPPTHPSPTALLKLVRQWLGIARSVTGAIEQTQQKDITPAARVTADFTEAGRWVPTFGCGHAAIPAEEMYSRIGGFVGFHQIIERPLIFLTCITGEMGVHQPRISWGQPHPGSIPGPGTALWHGRRRNRHARQRIATSSDGAYFGLW